MAKTPESGHYGLFYNLEPGSVFYDLCTAMAMVSPCYKYAGGKCVLASEVNPDNTKYHTIITKCVGANPQCKYYTFKYQYLNEDTTRDSDYIVSQHIVELAAKYASLLQDVESHPIKRLLTDGVVGTDGSIGITEDGCDIVLPKQAFVDSDFNVVTLPRSVDSNLFSDYLTPINTKLFTYFTPILIIPSALATAYNSKLAVLFGVAPIFDTIDVYNITDNSTVNELYDVYINTYSKKAYTDLKEGILQLNPLTTQILASGLVITSISDVKGNVRLLVKYKDVFVRYNLTAVDLAINITPTYFEVGANSVYDLSVCNSIDQTDGLLPSVKGAGVESIVKLTSSSDDLSVVVNANQVIDYNTCDNTVKTFYAFVGEEKTVEIDLTYGKSTVDDVLGLEVKLIRNTLLIRVTDGVLFVLGLEASVSMSDGNAAVFKPLLISDQLITSDIFDNLKTKYKDYNLDNIFAAGLASNICIMGLDSKEDLSSTGYIEVNNSYTATIKLLIVREVVDSITSDGSCYEPKQDQVIVFPNQENLECPKFDNCVTKEVLVKAVRAIQTDCKVSATDDTGLPVTYLDDRFILFIENPTADKYLEVIRYLNTNEYSDLVVEPEDINTSFLQDSRSFILNNHWFNRTLVEYVLGAKGEYPTYDPYMSIYDAYLYVYADIIIEPSPVIESVVEFYRYVVDSFRSVVGTPVPADLDLGSYEPNNLYPFYATQPLTGEDLDAFLDTHTLPRNVAKYDYSFIQNDLYNYDKIDKDNRYLFRQCYGLPDYGFLDDKLLIKSINLSGDVELLAKFSIRNISKFNQKYLFVLTDLRTGQSFLKTHTFPVLVSQVGGPELDIKYRWKSQYATYTYAYNGSGLNPFELNYDECPVFVNPVYYITYSAYRIEDNIFTNTDACTYDYGLIFTVWWPYHTVSFNDIYSGLAVVKPSLNSATNVTVTGNSINGSLTYENSRLTDVRLRLDNLSFFVNDYNKFYSFVFFDLDIIDYVYTPYCGDHNFEVVTDTPRAIGRGSDVPVCTTTVTGRSGENKEFEIYMPRIDTIGVLSYTHRRKVMPYNKLVGYMWFPFRSCEPARYHETADIADFRIVKAGTDITTFEGFGFECYDLIYSTNEGNLFVDFLGGQRTPNAYVTKYSCLSKCKAELEFFKKSVSNRSITIVVGTDTPLYAINPFGVKVDTTGIDEYVVYLNVDPDEYARSIGVVNYSFDGELKGVVSKSFINETLRHRNILPYNYNNISCIVGYERTRKGDASFIYQVLYPFHKTESDLWRYRYATKGTACGEEAYGVSDSDWLIPMYVPAAHPIYSLFMSVPGARDPSSPFYGPLHISKAGPATGNYADGLVFFGESLSGLFIGNEIGYSLGHECLLLGDDNRVVYRNLEIPAVPSTEFDYLVNYNNNIATGASQVCSVYYEGPSCNFPDNESGCVVPQVIFDKTSAAVTINHPDIDSLYYKKVSTPDLDQAVLTGTGVDYVPIGADLLTDGDPAHDGTIYYGFTSESLYKTFYIGTYKDKEGNTYTPDYKTIDRLPSLGCMPCFFRLFYFSFEYKCVGNYTKDSLGNFDRPFICDGKQTEADICFNIQDYAWHPLTSLIYETTTEDYKFLDSIHNLVTYDNNQMPLVFNDRVFFSDVLKVVDGKWVYNPSNTPFVVIHVKDYLHEISIVHDSEVVGIGFAGDFRGDFKIYDTVPFGSSIHIHFLKPNYVNGVNTKGLKFIVSLDGVFTATLAINVIKSSIGYVFDLDGSESNKCYLQVYPDLSLTNSFYKITEVEDENIINIVKLKDTHYEVYTGFYLQLNNLNKLEYSTITLYPSISTAYICIDKDSFARFSSSSLLKGFPVDVEGYVYVPVDSVAYGIGSTVIVGSLFMYSKQAYTSEVVAKEWFFEQQMFESEVYKYYFSVAAVFGKVVELTDVSGKSYYKCEPYIDVRSFYDRFTVISNDFLLVPLVDGILLNEFKLLVGFYDSDVEVLNLIIKDSSSLKAYTVDYSMFDTVIGLNLVDDTVSSGIEILAASDTGVALVPMGAVYTKTIGDVEWYTEDTFIEEGVVNTDLLPCTYSTTDIEDVLVTYINCLDSIFELSFTSHDLASTYGLIKLDSWYAPGHSVDVYKDFIQPVATSIFQYFSAVQAFKTGPFPYNYFDSLDALAYYGYNAPHILNSGKTREDKYDFMEQYTEDGTFYKYRAMAALTAGDKPYADVFKFAAEGPYGSVIWNGDTNLFNWWVYERLGFKHKPSDTCSDQAIDDLSLGSTDLGTIVSAYDSLNSQDMSVNRCDLEFTKINDYVVTFMLDLFSSRVSSKAIYNYSSSTSSYTTLDMSAYIPFPVITYCITHRDHKPYGYEGVKSIDSSLRHQRG